jgi:hypothetical protein
MFHCEANRLRTILPFILPTSLMSGSFFFPVPSRGIRLQSIHISNKRFIVPWINEIECELYLHQIMWGQPNKHSTHWSSFTKSIVTTKYSLPLARADITIAISACKTTANCPAIHIATWPITACECTCILSQFIWHCAIRSTNSSTIITSLGTFTSVQIKCPNSPWFISSWLI